MTDPGAQPQLAWLPVEKLSVDERYQRGLDTARSKRHIARIAANFRWINFQAILAVSDPQAGGWRIIDGQHRVAAARDAGQALVPAVIVPEADLAQQAAAFVSANRERVPVSAQAIYHAELLAGDPQAVTIAKMAAIARITIVRHNLGAIALPARHTSAIPAFRLMLRSHGSIITGMAMKLVADAWGDEAGSLRSPFFRAVGLILAAPDAPAEATIAAALKANDWHDLKVHARKGGSNGPALAMAEIIRSWIGQKPQTAQRQTIASSVVAPLKVARIGDLPCFHDDPRARANHGSPGRVITG